MAFRESSDRRIRIGRIVGLLFLLAGFTAIALAWNGAAGQACVDCQFPYLLSGGFGGLGMILLGSALLVVSGLRAERLHLQSTLEERSPARSAGLPERAAGESSSDETAAPAASAADGRVVAGRSTYHRPDCRLVKDRADLPVLTPEEAAASGLSACRICSPATPDQAGVPR